MRKDYKILSDSTTKFSKTSSSATPVALTPEIFDDMNRVEDLSRYDDFSKLEIDAGEYRENGMGFGIPFNPTIHTDGAVLRMHQTEAAKIFLSDLRGFGLLADCVGSGKTYEAGIVMSELAYRGKVKNLLIIVPDENLRLKWIDVIGDRFGMGKKTLSTKIDVSKGLEQITSSNGAVSVRPNGAFILLYDEFARLEQSQIKSYLFDLIVVDEAHNLCSKDDMHNRSMHYLSLLMQTKRNFNVPYCLLLTATPHSGNLESMFPLWYFIRCKGGTPACFSKKEIPSPEEKDEYDKERSHYLNIVCKGAKTVAEYIENAKQQHLIGTKNLTTDYRADYLSEFTYDGRKYPALKYEDYTALTHYEQKSRCSAYLAEHRDVESQILHKVKDSYSSEVMRSIMVRRRNDFSQARMAHSYFFLPIENTVAKPSASRKSENFTFDGINLNAEGFSKLFNQYGDKLFENERFVKKGSSDFYFNRFQKVADNPENDFIHIEEVPSTLEKEEDAIFTKKCEEFVKIVRDEAKRSADSSRMIVFFDYDLPCNSSNDDDKTSWYRLADYLTASGNRDIAERIIHGDVDHIENAISAYNAREDAILFAEGVKYSEGQDLQVGNVIVNFEVPIDPLTVDQRIGRVYRIGQSLDVNIYSFATMNALDGYCLAYFVDIGILSDRNGDASILSGCNSENMKALKCPRCNDISLVNETDYMNFMPNCPNCSKRMFPTVKRLDGGKEKDVFLCPNCKAEQDIPKENGLRCIKHYNGEECGTVRQPILFSEFVCEANPRHKIKRFRGDDGESFYACLSVHQNKMEYKPLDTGCRIGCPKFCALKNCKKIDPKCKIRVNNITDENEAKIICASCPEKQNCLCNVNKPVSESCSAGKCHRDYPTCNPKPYTIRFDANYENGVCPICKETRKKTNFLLPVKKNTFETYIKERYDTDTDFCRNFDADAVKTLEIKDILMFDDN